MSWTWVIDAGSLYDAALELQAKGYSGGLCGAYPAGVNNPACCDVPRAGPLPPGKYTIGAPQDTVVHGPYVLPLTPDPANEMYGRSAFLIHGDSVVEPGKQAASDGCIILPRTIREQIWASGDHDLEVIPTLNPLIAQNGDSGSGMNS